MSSETGVEAASAARDSLLLYRLCCDVGFSREQWDRRVRQCDSFSSLRNYLSVSLPQGRSSLYSINCGSTAEGIAADFLSSDTDSLRVLPGAVVIEQQPIPDQVRDNVFQFIPTEHAAYFRLQLVAIGDTQNVYVDELLRNCVTDELGRTVLSGQNVLTTILGGADRPQAQNGPALTFRMLGYFHFELDSVLCLHCKEWPTAQREWIHRHRPYNWPSPATVKEIVDGGCELVAIGHPSSRAPHLEWRLSSSLAEKRLVRSFNIYQIQCYFLLKLILVFLIKPLAPHTLCSYHMKTIMLHVVETTNPAEWTQHNLTNCLMKCIAVLRRFLEQGNCPQYFIPQHNLFDPKIRGETQRTVIRIVKDLQAEGWKCVLRCAPFNNFNTLCQHVEPRCPCYIKHWHELQFRQLLSSVKSDMISMILYQVKEFQEFSHFSVFEVVNNLLANGRAMLNSGTVPFPCHDTATKLLSFTKAVIGYSLLAAARCRNSQNPRLLDPIMQCAKRLLQESCDFDVTSCRLKLATFYYQTGQRDQCIQEVGETLERFTTGTLPVCVDISRRRHAQDAEYTRKLMCLLCLGSDVSTMFRHLAFSVMFSPWELLSAPPAIRDLHRCRPRVTVTDKIFHGTLFIDPLVYACYLLVICYTDLGRVVKCRQTLELMERTVLNHRQHYLFYPELAVLLLDYCVQYSRHR